MTEAHSTPAERFLAATEMYGYLCDLVELRLIDAHGGKIDPELVMDRFVRLAPYANAPFVGFVVAQFVEYVYALSLSTGLSAADLVAAMRRDAAIYQDGREASLREAGIDV